MLKTELFIAAQKRGDGGTALENATLGTHPRLRHLHVPERQLRPSSADSEAARPDRRRTRPATPAR